MTSQRRLSYHEFVAILAEELALPPERLSPQADFVQDLQIDSLALASMMLRLEDLGITVPLESAWEIRTVQDAYRCYLENQEGGEGAARTWAEEGVE